MVSTLALLVDLASTLFMTGLIWSVDRVHYPLFARVAREAFRDYHAEHTRRTAEVVRGPMSLELVTSIVLVVWPPSGSDAVLAWAGSGGRAGVLVGHGRLGGPHAPPAGARVRPRGASVVGTSGRGPGGKLDRPRRHPPRDDGTGARVISSRYFDRGNSDRARSF